MPDNKPEILIKDIALCLCGLNNKDGNSLCNEYREWIHEDLDIRQGKDIKAILIKLIK